MHCTLGTARAINHVISCRQQTTLHFQHQQKRWGGYFFGVTINRFVSTASSNHWTCTPVYRKKCLWIHSGSTCRSYFQCLKCQPPKKLLDIFWHCWFLCCVFFCLTADFFDTHHYKWYFSRAVSLWKNVPNKKKASEKKTKTKQTPHLFCPTFAIMATCIIKILRFSDAPETFTEPKRAAKNLRLLRLLALNLLRHIVSYARHYSMVIYSI